jgi:hypothetical protein
MAKDRGEIRGPENIEPGIDSQELARGIRGYKLNPKTFFNLTAIATLLLTSAGSCVEPTITPKPTDSTKPTPSETFVPTEKPTAEYKADIVDLTAFMENSAQASQIKEVYDAAFDVAKEMPEFLHSTPRIWTLAVNDFGPKIDGGLIIAQNQTTNENFIISAEITTGSETQVTIIKEKIFAEVVMGEAGQYQKIRYYYKEEDGSQTEFLRYDPENNINQSNYVYTMINGNEVALDGIGIYFGKIEDSTTGGKLLSLVPPGEDFYKNLPAGSVINTETRQITDSSGNVIYHYDGEWKKQPVLESGPSLEFSPLLPAVWSKEWTGKVGDLDIPIIIGLSEGVYNDKTPPLTPIKGVWMTQEGADAVADAFLRAAHYRYTKIMGNTATYEEYLDILKNQPHGGEVNLLITDNELDANGKATRREAFIDPRQGFSLLMTDKIDPKIGVKHDRNNTSFFGVDGQGRLLLGSDYFSRYDFNKVVTEFGVSTINSNFIISSFHIFSRFGYVNNVCFLNGNIDSTCGQQVPSQEYSDSWQLYRNKIEGMLSSKHYIPLWGLDR